MSRSRRQLVEPAREVVQPRVEDAALGLRVARDLVEPLPQRRFDLVRPVLERLQRVVPLALQRRAQAGEPFFHALSRGIADAVEPLGQDAPGFAREALDREVELAAET